MDQYFQKPRNGVYSIRCTRRSCKAIYIGQTGRSIQQRLEEHSRDTWNNANKSVSRHFNIPGHNLEQAQFTVLGWDPGFTKDEREQLEKEYIWYYICRGYDVINSKL